MATSTEVPVEDLLEVLRDGPLTEEQAREIVARGAEVAVFVILLLSKRLTEQQAKTAAESHQTPGRPDVHLPHPQTTRPRPHPNHHRRAGHLPHHRTTTTPA